MLQLLDILFTIVHSSVIIFLLFGWIWRKTRIAHFVLVILIASSWVILGIWHGWGYCLLTDLHWKIKERLGEHNLPSSFIKYMADKISGKDINSALIDKITLAGLLLPATISIFNIISYFRKRRAK